MTETVVILSTADFNAAVWTNKQHLAIRLAEHMSVSYVESIGLRQPKPSLADAKRVTARIFRKSEPRTSRGDLQIVKPQVLPLHRFRFIRAINSKLLNWQIGKLARGSNTPPVLWTFSPVTYGIERHFAKVVYHSVDLLHTLPHMPATFMLESERQLTDRADVIIASSTGVKHHLETLTAQHVELWENVADTRLYAAVANIQRKPRAVFAGNLTRSKVDFDLLHQLADAGIDVVLAGPNATDGTVAAEEIKQLKSNPNVTFTGNLKPAELARLLNSCTVGLIPYHVNEYTTGVFPMKVYEYLASGLAVVSTQLPSLEHLQETDIKITNNNAFARTVLELLHPNTDDIKRRKAIASSYSWERRTEDAVSIIKKATHEN